MSKIVYHPFTTSLPKSATYAVQQSQVVNNVLTKDFVSVTLLNIVVKLPPAAVVLLQELLTTCYNQITGISTYTKSIKRDTNAYKLFSRYISALRKEGVLKPITKLLVREHGLDDDHRHYVINPKLIRPSQTIKANRLWLQLK